MQLTVGCGGGQGQIISFLYHCVLTLAAQDVTQKLDGGGAWGMVGRAVDDHVDRSRERIQELLRHANSRITLDVYTQAVNSHKRAAQSKVVRMMVPNVGQREVETDSLLVPRRA